MTRPEWLGPVPADEFTEAVEGREVATEAYPLWAQRRRVPPPPPAQVVRLVPVARTTRVPLEGPREVVVVRVLRTLGGGTLRDLEDETGWRTNICSAALSRAKKKHLVEFTGEVRDGCGVHRAR